MKKTIALVLILALLLSGCAGNGTAQTSSTEMAGNPEIPVTEFSLALLRNSLKEGENALISPLSVLAALGMTANGADGETLEQMIQIMGLPQEELNSWISSRLDQEQMKLANAIWLRDDGRWKVEKDFLETNETHYHAEVFQSAFDNDTLNRLNGWVEEHTDGMIPTILDRLDPNAVMYLVNALAFEDQWEEPYLPYQVYDSTFTREDGTKQEISMMHSTESQYLETDNAVGFLKYYEGRHFAFAALLPDEGVSIGEFLDSLTGEALHTLLSQPQEAVVKAALPKFQAEFDAELGEILVQIGMTDAFDPDKADFSRLGTGSSGTLYISRVLHKTAITVAEEGTKAAAATAVEMAMGSAYMPDIKTVTLNRPFVYMLIDCRDNTPFFIGTMMDMENAAPAAAEAEQTEEIIPSPPELLLAADGEEAVLMAGNYEWTVPAEGFAAETVTACGPAPLDYAGKEPVFRVTPEQIQLSFRVPDGAGGYRSCPPDDITAAGWYAASGESVPVKIGQDMLIPDEQCDVIEITALWTGYGSASYILPIGN